MIFICFSQFTIIFLIQLLDFRIIYVYDILNIKIKTMEDYKVLMYLGIYILSIIICLIWIKVTYGKLNGIEMLFMLLCPVINTICATFFLFGSILIGIIKTIWIIQDKIDLEKERILSFKFKLTKEINMISTE